MILTRHFGALRARRVFPSVTDQSDELRYFGDVRSDKTLEPVGDSENADESAA